MSLKGVVRILNQDLECQAGHFPVSLWAPFEWGKPSVASPDRSCRHLSLLSRPVVPPLMRGRERWRTFLSRRRGPFSPRMVGDSPDQNNSNQARNPGLIRIQGYLLRECWERAGSSSQRGPLWHGGPPRNSTQKSYQGLLCSTTSNRSRGESSLGKNKSQANGITGTRGFAHAKESCCM